MWPNSGASHELSAACEDACLFKSGFDALLTSAGRGSPSAQKQLGDFGWGVPKAKALPFRATLTPRRFIERLLPFGSIQGMGSADEFRDDIDPRRIVGALYEDFTQPLDPVKLNAQCRAGGYNGRKGAWYIQVGTMPIAYAVEGKNRVSAYVSLGADLGGWVSRSSYPAPDELEMRHYMLLSCWSLRRMSDRAEQMLAFPDQSRRILDAYGVRTVLGGTPPRSLKRAVRMDMSRDVEHS